MLSIGSRVWPIPNNLGLNYSWPNGPHGTGTDTVEHDTAGHGDTVVPCHVVPPC